MAIKKEAVQPDGQLLRNEYRRTILLALWAEGPMSCIEISRSRFAMDRRDVNRHIYHLRKLVDAGLVESTGTDSRGRARYSVTDGFTQDLADSFALDGIQRVLQGIPAPLKRWIEGPYIDGIETFVEASGRPVSSHRRHAAPGS